MHCGPSRGPVRDRVRRRPCPSHPATRCGWPRPVRRTGSCALPRPAPPAPAPRCRRATGHRPAPAARDRMPDRRTGWRGPARWRANAAPAPQSRHPRGRAAAIPRKPASASPRCRGDARSASDRFPRSMPAPHRGDGGGTATVRRRCGYRAATAPPRSRCARRRHRHAPPRSTAGPAFPATGAVPPHPWSRSGSGSGPRPAQTPPSHAARAPGWRARRAPAGWPRHRARPGRSAARHRQPRSAPRPAARHRPSATPPRPGGPAHRHPRPALRDRPAPRSPDRRAAPPAPRRSAPPPHRAALAPRRSAPPDRRTGRPCPHPLRPRRRMGKTPGRSR